MSEQSLNQNQQQEAATLANTKYGHEPNLLSSEPIGTQILTDQEKLIEAPIDFLTGLYNRREWTNRTDILLKQFKRFESINNPDLNFVIMIMDLDNFKQINDTYGHSGGDIVLREQCKWLKQISRESDILGRYGGEELSFSGITRNDKLTETINKFADRRRQISAQPITIDDNHECVVTQSWGVAIFSLEDIARLPGPGSHLDQMIKLADEIMYQAKNAGRNCLMTNIDQTKY